MLSPMSWFRIFPFKQHWTVVKDINFIKEVGLSENEKPVKSLLLANIGTGLDPCKSVPARLILEVVLA